VCHATSVHGQHSLACDGCGAPADEKHLRERIERLEFATRFRPIHISVLFLTLSPPLTMEDYFYRPGSERSATSRAWFQGIMAAASVPGELRGDESAALAEFQRRNFFHAFITECPIDGRLPSREHDLVRTYGATLLKRLQFSLKPARIALLGEEAALFIPTLADAGWADRLLIESSGRPFDEGAKALAELISRNR
jgi:hypothetical protein